VEKKSIGHSELAEFFLYAITKSVMSKKKYMQQLTRKSGFAEASRQNGGF